MRLTRRTSILGPLATACPGLAIADNSGFLAAKRFARVRGRRMAYAEMGAGSPILFVHGNPTSSYLWRNIIPRVAAHGRCIAPDLIGMGDSDKLANSGPGVYTFVEHCRHLDRFIAMVAANEDIVLVLHDWGGPLGFHWARRHPHRVRAIAFMETFVASQNSANTPAPMLEFFTNFLSPEAERDVLANNSFVENVLLRQFPDMSEEDKAEYRRPFAAPGEGRRPTLEWPRQVPINGEPEDVHRITLGYLEFMARTPIPKLFLRGEPGGLIRGGREAVPRAWSNITERVVIGRHFLPEDNPGAVAQHLVDWLPTIGAPAR